MMIGQRSWSYRMIECDCGGGEFSIEHTKELSDGSRARYLKCWKCGATPKQIVPADIWSQYMRSRLRTNTGLVSAST